MAEQTTGFFDMTEFAVRQRFWDSLPRCSNVLAMGFGRYLKVPTTPPCYISADKFIGNSKKYSEMAIEMKIDAIANYDLICTKLAAECSRLNPEELYLIQEVINGNKVKIDQPINILVRPTIAIQFICNMQYPADEIKLMIQAIMTCALARLEMCDWDSMQLPPNCDFACDEIVRIIASERDSARRVKMLKSITHVGLLQAYVRRTTNC